MTSNYALPARVLRAGWLRVLMVLCIALAAVIHHGQARAVSLFTNQTPANPNGTDGVPYEVGMRFQVTTAGQVTAIRYWKAASDTGTHVGRIWSSTGTLLGSVTFTGETGSGWQQQALATPLTLTANTVYTVSVNVGSYFPVTSNGLSTQIINGDIRSATGANGVYGNSGTFPTLTFQASNYFRDVVFVPAAVGAPTKLALTPVSSNTTTGTAIAYTATIQDANGNRITTAANPITFSVTGVTGSFNPASPVAAVAGIATTNLTGSTPGTATITASAAGLASATATLVVSNATAGNQSLFTTQTPAIPSTTDGVPYEIGMKFRLARAGTITAIRFYKASGDTGTHAGRVWSATGTQLASVTFAGETASGWQQQALSAPLMVQANTTYIVSVNIGSRYPLTQNGLANQIVNGDISSVADGSNGVYGTPFAFPTNSWQNANYFRDIVFVGSTPTATKLALTPTTATSAPGAAVSYSATVQDANGNTVTTATNAITFSVSGVSGNFSPASPVSAIGGVATSSFTPSAIGNGTITVSAAGLTSATATLTVAAGAPTKLALTPSTTTTSAGTAVTYTATVQDANGNTVTTVPTPITFAVNGVSGSFNPTSPVTSSGGIATSSFTPTTLGGAAITVSAPGLTSATAALTVGAGTAAKLALVAVSTTTQAGAAVSYTATIQDANGNTVGSATNPITFGVSGVTGSFSPASPVSPITGVATTSFTAITAGSATITASAAGLTSATATLTVTTGPPAKLALVPVTTTAQVGTAVNYTATVQDANGNTVGIATNAVSFAVSGVSGTFSPTSPVTASAGIASSSLTPTTTGSAAITASAAGLTSATATLTVTAGAPAKLALVPVTTTTQVGTAVSYTATVQDASGHTIDTATNPITFSVSGVSGSFTPASPIAASAGVATSSLTPTTIGSATVTVSSPGLTSATASLTVTAGAASKLALVPSTTTTQAGTAVSYTATVQDANGNTIGTATNAITFAVSGVTGSFSPASPVTASSGVAVSSLTATTVGSATVMVSAAGLTSATATLTVTAGAAAKLVLAPSTTTVQAGNTVSYTATIEDANGNPVNTATNSVSFAVSGVSGTFSPASPVTASGGIATSSLTPTTTGSATVTVSAAGLTSASATLTVTAGTARKLVLVPSATSTQAGTAVTYTATIEDANGNTVTSPDHQVAFAVSGVSGSFSPSASIASSNGVAVSSLTPTTVGTATVTVTSAGLTSASATLTAAPGTPTKLLLVPAANNTQVGSPVGYTATIQDAHGNTVTTASNAISFSASGVAGSFNPASPVSPTAGVAASAFTPTTAGTATITASAAGLTSASVGLTVATATGQPVKLALVPATSSTQANHAVTYTAIVQDADGNTVTTATNEIVFAVTGVTGTFNPVPPITANGGLAVSHLAPTLTGTATVTVSSAGLTSASATLTVTPEAGPPAKLLLTPANATSPVGTAITYTATVADINDIPVLDATNAITFEVTGVAGTFAPTSPVNAVSGVAVSSLTPTTEGTATITVSAGGLTSASTSLTVAQVAGPAAKLALTPANATVAVGTAVAYNATIQDANGVTVTNATDLVTFSVTGVSGSFTPALPVSPTNGHANASFTATADGSATVTVSAPGLTNATAALTVTPVTGPPAKLTLVPATASTVVGTAVTYTAVVQDANGNTVVSATSPITFSVSGVSGTFDPASPITPTNGSAVASFTPSTNGTAEITVSAAGLTSATATLNVAVLTGPPSKLALLPTTATTVAGTAVSYTAVVQDANGNTIASATNSITFSVSGVTGTFSPSSPVAPTNGVATSSLTATTTGTATVTVTAAGLASASATLTVTPGAATKLALTPVSTSTQAGVAVSYTATIQDANGNTVGAATNPITFTVTGVSGTFGPSSPVTPTNGVATSNLTATTSGTATITVSAAGLTSATAALTVSTGAAAKLALTPMSTSTQAGVAVSYTATIQDANGNTVSTANNPITFAVSGVSGTFSPGLPVTPTNGVATSSLTATTTGTATITVSAAGLTSATATLTVNAGAASKLALTPASTSTQAGAAVSYTATIQDANGNTVGTANNAITFSVSGVTGTFSPSSPVAPTNGVATSSLAATTTGTATVTVTAAGLASVSATLTVTAGAPTKLALAPGNTSTQAGSAVSYTATVQDANGNTVTTATNLITFSVSGVSGTFNPASPVAAAAGVAYSNLTATTTGSATITVSAAGLTSATATLTVTAGAAAKLALSPVTTSAQVGTAVSYTVTIQDANGNTVTSATNAISFGVTGVSGTFAPASPVTATAGVATSSLTATTTGSAIVTVSAAGLTSATATLTVTAGAPAKLALTPASTSTQSGVAVTYTATVQDANGNTITNATNPITFLVTGVSGTFNPASPVTAIGGIATSSLSPTTTGSATITVTSAGLTSASASLTVSAGAASKLALVPATTTTAAGTAVTYTATVQDLNGNTVTTATTSITFSASGVSATFSPPSPIAAAAGVATSNLTPTTTGSASITVTAAGLTAATATLTVTAGAATKLALAPLNASSQAGVARSYTATIQDANGNTVTTATNAITFAVTGVTGSFSPASPVAPTAGVATSSVTATTVGTATITVTASGLTGASTSLTVTPGAATKLALTPASSSTSIGVARSYTATIQDANGNTVTTAANPITLSVTGVSGSFSPASPVTPVSGVATSNLTPTTAGSATVTASASGLTSATATLTVSGAGSGPSQSLFTTQTPVGPNTNDGVPYELGMKFQVTRSGKITALRYWKSALDTGTHVGRIWSASGTQLASVTFTGETASGWQQQALPTPLSILANTTYVVSVNVAAYFAYTENGLANAIVNADVRSLADGANGVFGNPFAFPTKSYHNSNYFRDIVFSADLIPSIVKVSGDNQAGTAGSALPNPLVVLVRDGNNNPAPGTTVSFAVTGGGSVSPLNTTTNASGQASTTLTLGTSGQTTVTATASGIGSVTFTGVVSNAIFIENQNAGTTDWQIGNPVSATTPEIAGYASATSVNKGGSLPMKISLATAGQYTINVYRLGWYGGNGGRLMGSFGSFAGVKQQNCNITVAATRLIECKWNTSFTLSVGSNWTSGMYVANLTAVASGRQSQIWFIVRDDSSHSDLVFQSSFTDFLAYNNYGEGARHSLYEYNSTNGQRAFAVSFDRPFGQVTVDPSNSNNMLRYERNLVRWLESQSYDVTYISNVDTHLNPGLLLQHKAYLSVGHDEYWSLEMRNGVEAARDNGVNLGFFSANTAYWRVRFEPSTSGDPNRVMVCYKDPAENDPVAPTYLWRGPENNRPENALLGVMYIGDYNGSGFDWVVSNASNAYFNNTGLTNGTAVFGLVGYEWDAVVNNGFTPSGLTILSASPVQPTTAAPGLPPGTNLNVSHSVRYTAASGAKVFSTGSIQYMWGLDNNGAFGGGQDSRIRQFVINVLSDLGAKPLTPSPGMIVP